MNQPGRGPKYLPSERRMRRSSGDRDEDGDQIKAEKEALTGGREGPENELLKKTDREVWLANML